MDVRPSPIAGQWYAGRPDQLPADVDGYFVVANADAPFAPDEGAKKTLIGLTQVARK